MPKFTITDEWTDVTPGDPGADNRAGKGSLVRVYGANPVAWMCSRAAPTSTFDDEPSLQAGSDGAPGEAIGVELSGNEHIWLCCDTGLTSEARTGEVGV